MTYEIGDRVKVRVTTNFIHNRFKLVDATIIKPLAWAEDEYMVATDTGRDLIVNTCAIETSP